jgi:Transglycosylase SLT domain
MSPAGQRRRKERVKRGTRGFARRRRLPLALVALASVTAASSAAAAGASGSNVTAGVLPVGLGLAYPPVDGGFPGFPGEVSPAATPTIPTIPVTPSATQPAVPTSTAGVAAELAGNGVPLVALTAYRNAERRLAVEQPACGLSWSLLAAIGRVESNHGRFAGAQLLLDGRSSPPVLGVRLDGRPSFGLIHDTDAGRLDGDTEFDRAVGPMQFIPSTWQLYAVDGDGDNRADPFDINDAALAAANYLCVGGRDLRTPAGLHDAVFSYNHSEDYVRLVLDLSAEYQRGVRVDLLPPGVARGGKLPVPPKGKQPPATVGPPPAGTPDPTPPTTTPPPSTPPPSTTPPPTATPTTPVPTTTAPTTVPPTSPPPTDTPTPTPSCTPTPTPTPTPTDTPTTSASPNAEPTDPPTPTDAATPAADATETPTPTPAQAC